MPITSEIKNSSANRLARRGHGITGLSLELQLVHLQNLAMLRDEVLAYLKSEADLTTATIPMQKTLAFLDFVVQQDFESPIADNLWNYDSEERLSTAPSKY